MANRDYGKVKSSGTGYHKTAFMADGGDVEAADKAAGLEASKNDKASFWDRIKAGNIDDPSSEAYNRWGAGRGRMEREKAGREEYSNSRNEARLAAAKPQIDDSTYDIPAPKSTNVEQSAATSGRDNDGPGTVSAAPKRSSSAGGPRRSPTPPAKADTSSDDAQMARLLRRPAQQDSSYTAAENAKFGRSKPVLTSAAKTSIPTNPKNLLPPPGSIDEKTLLPKKMADGGFLGGLADGYSSGERIKDDKAYNDFRKEYVRKKREEQGGSEFTPPSVPSADLSHPATNEGDAAYRNGGMIRDRKK